MTLPNDVARCAGQPNEACCEPCLRRIDISVEHPKTWFRVAIINGKCSYRIAKLQHNDGGKS